MPSPDMAMGGSTNTVLHTIAVAYGRGGISCRLNELAELSPTAR